MARSKRSNAHTTGIAGGHAAFRLAQAGVKALVYVSTVTVYPPMAVYREDMAWSGNPHPGDQYAAWAKRVGEKYVEALAIEHGFADVAVVRPVNTFGPHDDFDPQTALVVPALIARAETGESPFVVWGDGHLRE